MSYHELQGYFLVSFCPRFFIRNTWVLFDGEWLFLGVFGMRFWVLILVFFSVDVNAEYLDLGQQDKRLHMAMAGLTTSVFGGLLKEHTSYTRAQSVLAASAAVTLVGFAKEMLDPTFTGGDILANSIGVAGGALVLTVYFTFE